MSIKYLFCINTGRSGSLYLTSLLKKTENAISVHEGFPMMNGHPMQDYNNGDERGLRSLMGLKMTQMEKLRGPGGKIYCETNHSFIKGWGYLLPDIFIPQREIGVIILKRDAEKTATSLLRLHDVPGLSEWSRTWYLDPRAERNLMLPEPTANPYQLCHWYVEEISRRTEQYRARFPDITYAECELDQLNNIEFVEQLFGRFGIRPNGILSSYVGKSANTRQEWPSLTVDILLNPPRYPSADELSAADFDALIREMVRYIRSQKSQLIGDAIRENRNSYSLFRVATRIVADFEEELEDHFQIALKFTESERILINELLRSIAKYDLIFLNYKRSSSPRLSYTYDFNSPTSARSIFQSQGFPGLISYLPFAFRKFGL